MPSPTTLTLALLPAIISAHFSIVYPTTRGTENEEQMINYPCGGYPSVSNTRTQYPLNGAPITINNEHAESHVSAVLALGNNPRPEDFVYQLIPTVETRGPREFCMGNVDVLGALMRAGLMDATMQGLEGMNATIMVSTDSHGENEGLYNVSRVFPFYPALPSHCISACLEPPAHLPYASSARIRFTATIMLRHSLDCSYSDPMHTPGTSSQRTERSGLCVEHAPRSSLLAEAPAHLRRSAFFYHRSAHSTPSIPLAPLRTHMHFIKPAASLTALYSTPYAFATPTRPSKTRHSALHRAATPSSLL